MAATTHETHVFPLLDVYARTAITPEIIERLRVKPAGAEIQFLRGFLGRELVAQVHMWFATRKHVERVQWPTDWWEAVKERFAPRWARERWPVRYTAKELDARAIWPSFPYPAEWGKAVQFVEVRNIDPLEEE